MLYGGSPTSLYEVPARAFEQKYPGIKVTIHAGFSNVCVMNGFTAGARSSLRNAAASSTGRVGRDRGGRSSRPRPQKVRLGVAVDAGIGNVGAGMTPIVTGDYNGDGKADILFQKVDGTPVIWTMGGTAVTATTRLVDPGQNWRAKTG